MSDLEDEDGNSEGARDQKMKKKLKKVGAPKEQITSYGIEEA